MVRSEILDKLVSVYGLQYDHVSSMRGYVSRKKVCEIKQYIGRFGIGVKVLIPRFDTTQYVYCMYYVLPRNCKRSLLIRGGGVGVIDYEFNDYKVGKYEILFEQDGYTFAFKKDRFKFELKGWDEICALSYSDQ